MSIRQYIKISRNDVIRLIAKVKILILSKSEIENFVECDTSGMDNEEIEHKLIDMFDAVYAGVTNDFLSDVYYILTQTRLEVIGDVKESYTCDCCGYHSLSEKFGIEDGGWDICEYCSWEDTSVKNETQHCGCNHGSILEYRENIKNNSNFYYRNMWLKS